MLGGGLWLWPLCFTLLLYGIAPYAGMHRLPELLSFLMNKCNADTNAKENLTLK
jgi:hypothetical protein